jgi:hypothetical protein
MNWSFRWAEIPFKRQVIPWGRRGPSVHLNYQIQKAQKFVVFYNELTILEDPIGSYFMANGFKEGYFGIQVNSKTERRVLFQKNKAPPQYKTQNGLKY